MHDRPGTEARKASVCGAVTTIITKRGRGNCTGRRGRGKCAGRRAAFHRELPLQRIDGDGSRVHGQEVARASMDHAMGQASNEASKIDGVLHATTGVLHATTGPRWWSW